MCNRCIFYNFNVERMCKICGGRRLILEFDMSNYWSCDKCILYNLVENVFCVVCGFKRNVFNLDFFFNVRIIFVFEFKIDSLRYVNKNVVNRKEGSVKFDKMGNVKKLNSVERNKM